MTVYTFVSTLLSLHCTHRGRLPSSYSISDLRGSKYCRQVMTLSEIKAKLLPHSHPVEKHATPTVVPVPSNQQSSSHDRLEKGQPTSYPSIPEPMIEATEDSKPRQHFEPPQPIETSNVVDFRAEHERRRAAMDEREKKRAELDANQRKGETRYVTEHTSISHYSTS